MRPKKHHDAPQGGDKSRDAEDKPAVPPEKKEDETSEENEDGGSTDESDENV